MCTLLCSLCSNLSASSLSLPVVHDSADLLHSCVADPLSSDASVLQAGGIGAASNNIGSLWVIGEPRQAAQDYGGSTAYALLQRSQWLKLSRNGWSFTYGVGRRAVYAGNADAAQLWIDVRSENRTQRTYAPEARGVEFSAYWYGVGRDFPIRTGNLTGVASLSIRRVITYDYLARSLIGEVPEEEAFKVFTAMMRSVSTGPTSGDGWAVDGDVRLRYGDRWVGQAAVEGLLGCVSWKGLTVEDGLIVSPRTFTDPEGFLRDCGGITGATWTENRTARLCPYYRLDLMRTGRPAMLLGISFRSGERIAPNFGAAWPQKRRWIPYTRYYPVQRRLEVGAVGSTWRLRISGDDWIYSSPRNAEVSAGLHVLTF